MKKIFKRLIALFALFSFELIIVWLVFIGSLFVFIWVWRNFVHQNELEFDNYFFQLLDRIRSAEMTIFVKIITALGSFQIVLPICCLIFSYFLFIKKHAWYTLKIPVVAAGSVSLNLVLKYIFSRPRPILPLDEAFGFSFPSGHAMVSFSFYGLLLYIVWREVDQKKLKYGISIFLLLLILLIGFSRVYLRVHYATDVLAGFAVGGLWLIISLALLRLLEKFSRKKIEPVLNATSDND